MGPWAFYGSSPDTTTTPTGSGYAWYDATSGFVRDYQSTDADYVAVAGSSAGMSGVSDTSNAVLSGAITGQTTATVNTVNLGLNNLTMTASNTLSARGLLSSGSAAAQINLGNLQPKDAGGELVVRVDKSTDILTVTSVIQDNTSASSLTKSGAGKLTLSTAPTYTGRTTVAGGNLTFSASTLGTLPSTDIVVDSADLTLPSSAYYVGNNSLTGGTSNNKITIQNAGRLNETQLFYIGYGVNADNNTITVDGIGSQLTNSGGSSFLWLGFSGDHNKIVVSNGGYYGANGGNAGSRHYVGENMGADYNTIEVKGAGSLLETSGNGWLTIGGMGSNNGASLSQGGMMWTGALTLGGVAVGVAGGSNNTVSVADAGSIFVTRKSLSIGRGVNAANNGITVSNGGTLYNQGQNNINEAMHAFEIGASTGADNNYVVVTGAGSKWIADAGWDFNTNQGYATNSNVGMQNGVIGYAATATGNHVDILDGATFAMTVRLDIGGVNSKLNLGNGIGAKSLGTFRSDVALNTGSARVVLNNGEFKFASAAGTISGPGKVQLDGAGYFTSEWAGNTNSIASEITGVGSLIKDGPGLLSLTGANTYTGDTSVLGGILSLTNPVLNDVANVSLALSSVLNLNFSGTDTIGGLTLGGVSMAPGVYDSTNSSGYLTGTGTLTVVPEPGTFGLLAAAGLAAATAMLPRRRR